MLLQHFFYFLYRYIYGEIWKKEYLSGGLIEFGNFLNDALYIKPYCRIAMSIGWFIFFCMSGINFHFSKNNKKRVMYLLIFFLSYYFICFLLQNFTLYPLTLNFGIFLGYALFILLFDFIKIFPFWVSIVLCIAFLILSICSYTLNFNLEVSPFRWFNFSQKNKMDYLDQWYLCPSIFFYSLGYIMGKLLYKEKKSKLPFLEKKIFIPVLFFGKNSKYIYLGNLVFFPVVFIFATYIINGGL